MYLGRRPVTGQRQIPPLNLSRVSTAATASLPSVPSSNSSLSLTLWPPHPPAPTPFSHCDGSLAAPNCDDEAWLRSICSIRSRPIWPGRQDFLACVGGNNPPDWPPRPRPVAQLRLQSLKASLSAALSC
ncbi:hypothetical protein CORC01_03444 [Colletotrichum orchidophilum]|uniref:Uncharacterized protein n=1 Tax=Colletotrichum orchidophilum TaxID=1209926 RepID=A0A1G4BHZ6_9PEZI|nr:uncharacterized protein CORC01_03444 [Colletotrichum orchidophilum]OHF01130.1 hypothetical protein CORC01_03444 [Colletotrichum orchidophilum]